MLLAAGAGVAVALVYLAADYLLLPDLRLRAARRRGPEALARLVDHERRHLSRLRDRAAVREEHGYPDAAALRDERTQGPCGAGDGARLRRPVTPTLVSSPTRREPGSCGEET